MGLVWDLDVGTKKGFFFSFRKIASVRCILVSIKMRDNFWTHFAFLLDKIVHELKCNFVCISFFGQFRPFKDANTLSPILKTKNFPLPFGVYKPFFFLQGTSVVVNEPINWTFPNVPIMPYGDYRFRLHSGKPRKKALLCFTAECTVMPKI